MMTETRVNHRVALPKLCPTGTVICIATGPSLTPQDVEYCRGKGTVLTVNDAHRLAPWADVLYSSDRYWWRYYHGVPAFPGVKATIEFSPKRYALELVKLVPEMFFLANTGHHGLESDPTGLRTCGQNSGGAALNLALHLGARRILLLGYDCGTPGSQRHFFGDHPRGLSNMSNFPTWRSAFETMAKPFADLGVDVVNCSRSTSISAFPCVPLKEALV